MWGAGGAAWAGAGGAGGAIGGGGAGGGSGDTAAGENDAGASGDCAETIQVYSGKYILIDMIIQRNWLQFIITMKSKSYAPFIYLFLRLNGWS